MLVFLDESGTFQIPSAPHIVSVVGAVVIPHFNASRFFREIHTLLRPWKEGELEIKGSQLNEAQVAAIAQVLSKYDPLIVATAIDLSTHSDRTNRAAYAIFEA